MTALHAITVPLPVPDWTPTGGQVCPSCRETYGQHFGWECPNGGEWPVDARYEGYEDDFDIEPEEEDHSVCDHCGDHRFERTLYGRYTELHTFNSQTDREDWNGIDDTEVQEYGPWQCVGCGHHVDADVADYINQRT